MNSLTVPLYQESNFPLADLVWLGNFSFWFLPNFLLVILTGIFFFPLLESIIRYFKHSEIPVCPTPTVLIVVEAPVRGVSFPLPSFGASCGISFVGHLV